MTGSGLMNFGAANVGMFGQQPWQKQARESAFSNLFSRRLGISPSVSGSYEPSQIYDAMLYASSSFPRQATIGTGSLSSLLRAYPFMSGMMGAGPQDS